MSFRRRALSTLFQTATVVLRTSRQGTQTGNAVIPFTSFTATSGTRAISVASLKPSDNFQPRHNSITKSEEAEMVKTCGFKSLDHMIDSTVPYGIKRDPLNMGKYHNGYNESEFLEKFKKMASRNRIMKSYIGMGYYGTYLPPVIQRNLLENPGWYTQYTPYQAEIAQGRLESLMNFQTMVCDLTGLDFANSSLLDEGTAAAEAMAMCSALTKGKRKKFFISNNCHPQTIAVCQTRAEGLGLEVIVGDEGNVELTPEVCGVLIQYPATNGGVKDYSDFTKKVHASGARVVVASDLLAMTLLTPPGEWGADVVVGSAQRFGVPMGYGGPHAGFFACSDQHKRLVPGRVIGVSKDAHGEPAYRMALQTREQHIRRDKATSNICTAQALLANIAAMYGVYHGPEGLKTIANRTHGLACTFASGVRRLGLEVGSEAFFDTVCVRGVDANGISQVAVDHGVNLRILSPDSLTVSFDETSKLEDIDLLFGIFNGGKEVGFGAEEIVEGSRSGLEDRFQRQSPFMTQSVFNSYHCEHEMLRYLKRLENRDLSLCHSMIPLGSCTMKLNATTEMIPVTWPELADIHPFAPQDQTQGYMEMFRDLCDQLCEITGFDSVSLQPNAGASGEYAGLMAIRAYHQTHGTNPASAVMAGMKIVSITTDELGNVNLTELKEKAEKHKDHLAAFMITYPSTYGVYEEGISKMCEIIHSNGGQVYMDGANMNAQVGLTAPGIIGADVCHLNLHKTFCIPHGGGGPGMGPIGVKKHLAPFLPSHPVVSTGGLPVPDGAPLKPFGTIAAAPFGSSLILPISFAYIAMMGSQGLTHASKLAILNANYMARELKAHYPVLFTGKNGTNAHEFILDVRPFKESANIEPEDIAKRLIDYGFHAPTMSWPVAGTLMIEPTESESKAELDRFISAMISIRSEIQEIIDGKVSKDNNLLKNSPHSTKAIIAEKWDKPYSREKAAFPAPWTRVAKFWPTTGRIDNVYGDRHLIAKLPSKKEQDMPQAAAA
eukprot:g6797.t1